MNFPKPCITIIEGKRKLNVYKKRIIEDWIQKGESPHVSLSFHREEQTLHVDIVFSKPIEKLIEFCVAAEQSGMVRISEICFSYDGSVWFPQRYFRSTK